MIRDKRGLSTIVVTLIIILLSLAAVGIVWLVINNIIKSGTQGLEISSKCLDVSIEATKANCSAGATTSICDITLMRTGVGEDAIAGVKLMFRNATSDVSSGLINELGDIEPLVGKRTTGIDTGILNAEGVDRVEVTVFFLDSMGKEQICAQTTSLNF